MANTKGSDFYSQCSGKPAFDSPRDATKVMKSMSRRASAKRHAGIEPYRCHFCSKWHLGRRQTQNGQELRKLQRRFVRAHSPA